MSENLTNITELANFIDNTTIDKTHIECCNKIILNLEFLIKGDLLSNFLKIVIDINKILGLSDFEIKKKAYVEFEKMVTDDQFMLMYETRRKIEKAFKKIDEEKRLKNLN